MSSLAHRLKSKREQMGLTQVELAEKINVTQQAIQKVETGETKKPRFLYDAAKALECDLSWLLSGKADINVSPTVLASNKVPLISFVQAGLWHESCELRDSTGFDYILTSLDLSDNSFALTITGRSMMPLFNEGDVIIVDPNIKPIAGDFVVAENGESEATFKKYRELGIDEQGRVQFELVPLNDDFPKQSTLTQQIRIVGVMVEHRIYRRR